ncbi:hypothetical protein NHX12_031570 [Muraenolepis orangiensis]|uniref:Ion transport domain-containing protein n=1 Tax=Muraenolepis orangiensis TaxID=630683 RepID=A0A9Q0E845_9TELE|nr:hypothetical protein NHX12_031570 [Muraenolepis orangiensis]
MVIKMMALGIFGSKCYLGDTWNRLDFFIVMAGMMEYSLDGHNASLSAIRTVRVLRPLRAINRVPKQGEPLGDYKAHRVLLAVGLQFLGMKPRTLEQGMGDIMP